MATSADPRRHSASAPASPQPRPDDEEQSDEERDESADEPSDGSESEFDEAELEASHSAFIASGRSTAATAAAGSHAAAGRSSRAQPLSSLPWCRPFIERDEAASSEEEDDSDLDDDDDSEGGVDSADREAAADEELEDLKREYGRPMSRALQSALPTLTARLGDVALIGEQDAAATTAAAVDASATGAPHKPAQLLRAYAPGQTPPRAADAAATEEEAAEEEEDDWDLLGLPCDCPCDSCTVTAVAPSYAEYQALQRARAAHDDDQDDAGGESSPSPCQCECVQFDPPHTAHELILHVLEDFFRYRVHLHRITFATSLANHDKRMQRQQTQQQAQGQQSLDHDADATERLESHRRRHYDRSLSLLRARARRDLKHLELLEACANQLGWNHPAAPAYHPLVAFVETARPGAPGAPPLLAWVVGEFLEYFLVQKTATSNFDKATVAVLCANLVQFAIHSGDLDPSDREVVECMRVCERSQLDLPLADMLETELYKFVEERREREQAAAAAAASAAAANGATVSSDANASPGAGDDEASASGTSRPSSDAPSSSAAGSLDTHAFPLPLVGGHSGPRPVLAAFQGYWIVESYSDPSGLSVPAAHRAPPLLHLTPAVPTRSKMEAYRALAREEREAERSARGKDHSLGASADSGETAAPAVASSADGDAASATAASSVASSSTASAPSPSPSLSLSSSSRVSVVVPHSALELLAESSDGGRGWRLNLEIARYRQPLTSLRMRERQDDSDAYFHITKAGHVSCA